MTTTDSSSSILKLGFLGPPGSHSNQAVLKAQDLFHWSFPIEVSPYPTLASVMQGAESGEVSAAILPYENSLEGSVLEVLETLGRQKRALWVHAELLQPITHCLIQKAPVTEQIHTVYSHPQALAQCRDTLQRLFGTRLTMTATSSTSEAVRLIKESPNPEGIAAVGTRMAAKLYGLQVSVPQLNDHPDNLTRFFLVSNQPECPLPLPALQESSYFKTSVCVGLPEYPGVLMDCLKIFKDHQVNLTKLESRPSRKRFGQYYFYLDAEGDITKIADGRFYQELQATSTYLNVKGPYLCLGYEHLQHPPQQGSTTEAEQEAQGKLLNASSQRPSCHNGL